MKKLKETLMERDNITSEEADAQIQECKDRFEEYISDSDMDSAFDIMEEMFGLEPDYLTEIFY